ncbi:MAG: amino acid racemase [archaeon]
MKHIGIIGGLSPESTIEYYKIICKEYNKLAGGLNFPQITIRSINLEEIVGLFSKGQWDNMAEVIISAIYDLQKAGASFVGIATNTPHNAFERIKEFSPLEVLSIMDATALEIKKDGIKKVGLLGTKQTMEYGFFQKTFAKYGIETILPDDTDRNYIDNIIWGELVYGNFKESSKKNFKKIIKRLVNDGAKGIILGCTEIPILINQSDIDIQAYNTTEIHARAILSYAMKE